MSTKPTTSTEVEQEPMETSGGTILETEVPGGEPVGTPGSGVLETEVSEIGSWTISAPEEGVETTVGTEIPAGTETPAGPEFLQQLNGSPWLWAALGLAAVLVGCVLWQFLSKKKKPTEVTSAESASAAQTAGITPVVVWELGAREDQQDAYGMSDPAKYPQQGMIAVVADGMGGLSNGGMVSNMLVRSCVSGYEGQSPLMQPSDRLLELLTRSNEQVNRMLAGRGRSGSTLVMTMIKDGYLDFLTVGDSHLYLCRGGGLILLNREHVYREELALRAANRQIAPQQIELDRQKKALTSYLGIGQLSHLDRSCEPIKLVDGDRLLLCSDGVFGTLSARDMERALSLDGQAAADALREMVTAAKQPHQDNFTAVILEYHG